MKVKFKETSDKRYHFCDYGKFFDGDEAELPIETVKELTSDYPKNFFMVIPPKKETFLEQSDDKMVKDEKPKNQKKKVVKKRPTSKRTKGLKNV